MHRLAEHSSLWLIACGAAKVPKLIKFNIPHLAGRELDYVRKCSATGTFPAMEYSHSAAIGGSNRAPAAPRPC